MSKQPTKNPQLITSPSALLSKLDGVAAVLGQDLSLTQVRVFLYVAVNEGCSMGAMEQALKLTQSTSSRAVALLTAIERPGRPGLGVIERVEDPYDRRTKVLSLTYKGRKAVDKILS